MLLTLLALSKTIYSQKKSSSAKPQRKTWDLFVSINQNVTSTSNKNETNSAYGSTQKIFSTETANIAAVLSIHAKVKNDADLGGYDEEFHFNGGSAETFENLSVSGNYSSTATIRSEETLTGKLFKAEDRKDIESGSSAEINSLFISVKGNEVSFSVDGTFKTKARTLGKWYGTNPQNGKTEWVPYEENSSENSVSISASCNDDNSNNICKLTRGEDGYLITGNYSLIEKPPVFDGTRTTKTNFTVEISSGAKKGEVEVVPLAVEHPHCVCSKSADAVLVEFTAQTKMTGGTFDKFILEYDATPPLPLKNEGGNKPALILKGSGLVSGKSKIIAVYIMDGKEYKSKPFELNWCSLDTIKFENSIYNIGENCFVFESGAPGDLEITPFTRVWKNGKEINESIQWDIRPNQNNMFSKAEIDGPRRVKFKADKLPEKNSDFGIKKIKVKYNDSDCDCEGEEKEVKIFFPRDAKNNPEGKLHNWAYYWKQTSAYVKTNFEVVPKVPSMDNTYISLPGFTCLGPILNEGVLPKEVFARYDFTKDKIFFPENFFNLYCPARSAGAPTTDLGIDCFAVALRHENQHRVELTKWWGVNLKNYSCLNDIDGDLVPNEVEKNNPGCNYLDGKSCSGRPAWFDVRDIEMDAYQVGWSWRTGSADKEDWACPGKQALGSFKF